MTKRDASRPPPAPLVHNPFAGLAAKLGMEGRPAPPEVEVKPAPVPARAWVRVERAGRRGRQVTMVEGMELSPDELDRWLAEMRKEFACGGAREEGALVLQGDQREQARAFLERRGVGRVSVAQGG
ncbi:MAG TPA: translation initiation factor [Anaeromyxobacteraceae bacterium]|nr:translation initiation factor [Anaeromyxobacteraceae bacterium]